jgi:hypothetical protein
MKKDTATASCAPAESARAAFQPRPESGLRGVPFRSPVTKIPVVLSPLQQIRRT